MTDEMDKALPNDQSRLTPVERDACVDRLKEFIAEAKALTIDFGRPNFRWDDWRWAGVGTFSVIGALKGPLQKTIDPVKLLHSHFIDFAKAYLCYRETESPSIPNRRRELAMLRMVEQALREEGAGGDPTKVSLHTLDRAVQLAREHFKERVAYGTGQYLVQLAGLLQRKGLTRNAVGSFSNPLQCPDNMLIRLGGEADRHRQNKLPDERALQCVGTVFSTIEHASHTDSHVDVFVTSAITMLLAGSKRGGELFEATTDVLYSEHDSDGIERFGLRWHSFKNQVDPSRIAWIPEPMVPYVKEAIQRLIDITEPARAFARYCEQQLALRKGAPNAKLCFYRHPGCPDVPDDEPLGKIQVLAALGSKSTNPRNAQKILRGKGLSSRLGAYTLNSLWPWVLDRLPPGFPYVEGAKNKRLKYSDALFCMHPLQLAVDAIPSMNPVALWMPTLGTLMDRLKGRNHIPSFFERHRAMDEDGNPLRLKSHQIRHLLDTIEHSGTGETFLETSFINAAAGRANAWQGRTYDHTRVEDKAEIVRDATQLPDGRNALFDLPVSAVTKNELAARHWSVRLKPRSVADIDMHHRSATIATIWGGCEHDWLLKPCPHYRDCLNCTSHVCIKGMGKDDQDRLARLKELLAKIIVQQANEKAAVDQCVPGSKFWYEYQTTYSERVEGLIWLLENPETQEGAEIRLAGATANTHLHRVLQEKAVLAVENRLAEAETVEFLLSAYRENRPMSLDSTIPQLESPDGT